MNKQWQKKQKKRKATPEETFMVTVKVLTSKGVKDEGEILDLPKKEMELMVKQNLAKKL